MIVTEIGYYHFFKNSAIQLLVEYSLKIKLNGYCFIEVRGIGYTYGGGYI